MNPLLPAAIESHQAGRLHEAEQGYRGLLQGDPDDPDALQLLGLLRFQQQRGADAEALMRQSLILRPDNPHAWNNLGNVLLAQQKFDLAVEAYLKAVDLDVELAAAWKNLGTCLEYTASPERAIALFRRIIETVPGFVPAYDALGRVLRVFGRNQEALEVYRRWQELEPDRPTARHMLAAASGQAVPARADDAYISELFDAFAEDFDERLRMLEYRAPQLLVERIAHHDGAPAARLHILDAGCGTGLCGPLLRPYAERLTGVDLSAAMLERAGARSVYDALEQAELTDYLGAHPGGFDGIISADTLCYFGALEPVLVAALGALRQGGWLAFTLERLPADECRPDYRLEPHGRYTHSVPYLERVLSASGFAVQQIDEVVLRQEVRRDVVGLAVMATRP